MGLAEAAPLVRRVLVRLPTTTRRRSARSFAKAGFTLLELLIVVTLIALIAMIAVPTMTAARADKLAFNYARNVQQIYAKARAHAVGSGAAQIVVFTNQFGNGEGAVLTFESRDNTCIPGAPAPCPSNPSARCTNGNTFAAGWSIGTPNNPALGRIVPEASLNIGTSSVADIRRAGAENIRMTANLNGGGNLNAIAMCFTPLGETYVGTGGDMASAVNTMLPFGLPFGDTPATPDPTTSGIARVEILVQRNTGLRRRVIITGGSASRIRSE